MAESWQFLVRVGQRRSTCGSGGAVAALRAGVQNVGQFSLPSFQRFMSEDHTSGYAGLLSPCTSLLKRVRHAGTPASGSLRAYPDNPMKLPMMMAEARCNWAV